MQCSVASIIQSRAGRVDMNLVCCVAMMNIINVCMFFPLSPDGERERQICVGFRFTIFVRNIAENKIESKLHAISSIIIWLT